MRSLGPRVFEGVALAIGFALLLAALPVAALHWSGSGAFGPTSVYQGVSTTFTFTIYNQASGTLDVSWVWVHFCWEVSNYGYYFKANDGTTVSVAGSGSRDFTGNIPVDPSTLGSCAVSIQVNGQAVGDLFSETATYSASITVLQIPPLQVSISANPNNGQSPLSVQFTSTVTGGLSPYDYSWSFGDGGTSSSADPSYAYQTSGTYTVTLVVTDSVNNQKSATATVTVTPPGIGGGVVSGLGGVVIGGLVLLVVIVLVVVAVVLRSRRRRTPPPPIQPQMPPQPPLPPQ